MISDLLPPGLAAIAGAIAGSAATLLTARRDTNFDHGAIVTEYKGLVESQNLEISRLTAQVVTLYTLQLAASERAEVLTRRVAELEGLCLVCPYRAGVKAVTSE